VEGIRALAFLVIGLLGAANALCEIAGETALNLAGNTWHFLTIADLGRGSGVALPAWLAVIPTAPVFLVLGSLLAWQGFGILSGRDRAGSDAPGEQERL